MLDFGEKGLLFLVGGASFQPVVTFPPLFCRVLRLISIGEQFREVIAAGSEQGAAYFFEGVL